MKRNLYLSRTFLILAILLSDIMCANVAHDYCALKWCGRYAGCSAPASVAFLLFIPYGIVILICILLAWLFHRKYKKYVKNHS